MAEYGMTNTGFIPKRLAEIQASLTERIADISDPNTGEFPYQNVSDDTLLQQLIGVFSEALADCWNAAYAGATQFDPLKNFGSGQSGTVQLNAILRKAGAPTIITLELGGAPGTVVPAGNVVSTNDNVHQYATQYAVTLDSSGSALVPASAIDNGDFVPNPNTVIKIVTPLTGGGWTSASNVALVSTGTNAETDEELRMRQQRSTSLTSYRLIEAIYAAVYNIEGVIYCRAYQNPNVQPEDERGIPFKEVAVVVEGGDPAEIAEALFLRLPTGQIGYGNTSETVFDKQGFPYQISFSRAENVEIFVDITVRVTDASLFPDDAQDQIAKQIVSFVEYIGADENRGFAPGSDVVRTRLYTPINRVPGHSILSLKIGTTTSTGEQDIPIAWNKVARFDASRISVIVQS